MAQAASNPVILVDPSRLASIGSIGDLAYDATTLTLLERPNAGSSDCTGWHAGVFDGGFESGDTGAWSA
jgi:hypothetical protein